MKRIRSPSLRTRGSPHTATSAQPRSNVIATTRIGKRNFMNQDDNENAVGSKEKARVTVRSEFSKINRQPANPIAVQDADSHSQPELTSAPIATQTDGAV